jgi:hypothetical protein
VRRYRLQAGAEGRSARDQGRRLHPQDLDRRTAAALQRGVQGKSLIGRAAPARGPCQGRGPAL